MNARIDLVLALVILSSGVVGCGGSGVASVSGSQLDLPTAISHRSVRAHATLYSFQGGLQGSYPDANLISVNGDLYGTTSSTAFKLTASGDETVLHRFQGDNDGGTAYSSLLEVDGAFYGTTANGGGSGCGGSGCGTVYEITSAGSYSTIYSFQGGADGRNPVGGGGLTDLNGTLYGATSGGGSFGAGTVFSVTLSGKESVLHSFGARNDGVSPAAGLVALDGVLYGTTVYGGRSKRASGTVYSITTSGKETVLYTFEMTKQGCNGGANGLVVVGNAFYGTTLFGGVNGTGCVYALTLDGKKKATVSIVYEFGSHKSGDGVRPSSGLLYSNGELYGTTLEGGQDDGGTLFEVSPSGVETILYDLEGHSSGGATIVNGVLYGTTYRGGAYGYGSVFSLSL